MKNESIFIVAYDVKAKFTQKCAKVLENYGERLQQSVFLIYGENMMKGAVEDINKMKLNDLNLLVFEVKRILDKERKYCKESFILL